LSISCWLLCAPRAVISVMKPIVPIHHKNVAVRRNGQSQRIIQAPTAAEHIDPAADGLVRVSGLVISTTTRIIRLSAT